MNWMRQKSELEIKPTATKTAPESARPPQPASKAKVATRGGTATIGVSVELNGELISSEDLAIEGKVEGKITMMGSDLTIGKGGRVRANVQCKSIVIAGQLKGKVSAKDKVEIAASGSLRGDICAPRVAIADGAKFKGGIDMNGKASAPAARAEAAQRVKTTATQTPTGQGLSRSA